MKFGCGLEEGEINDQPPLVLDMWLWDKTNWTHLDVIRPRRVESTGLAFMRNVGCDKFRVIIGGRVIATDPP